MTDIDVFFKEASAKVEVELDRLLGAAEYSPANLIDAMRWSIFAGGKRFRPALVIASGRTFGVDDRQLLSAAAAVEMVHTYSLIHDDLPSMDDDDLRRGRETCHRKYGEATAILAGDALQAKAFQTIAEDDSLAALTRVRLIAELGEAAARMVAGQQFDLDAEGKELSIDQVKRIHSHKTGALISFSVAPGALIGEISDDELDAIRRFGNEIGLLFQITDDLLDIVGSTASLGKTAGKDIASRKATYPSVIGDDASRKLVVEVAENARASLSSIDRNTDLLSAFVDFLVERQELKVGLSKRKNLTVSHQVS